MNIIKSEIKYKTIKNEMSQVIIREMNDIISKNDVIKD